MSSRIAWAGGGAWTPDEPPSWTPPKKPEKEAPKTPDPPDEKPPEKDPDPKVPKIEEPPKGRKSGLVLGRFSPPHLGHALLIDFARSHVRHLTVLLFSRSDDPIPGDARAAWLRESFPGVEVLHARDVDTAALDPRGFVATVRRFVPEGPAYCFSSDDHGLRFAELLGAEHVSVDPKRLAVPVSATMIRDDPMGCFEMLLPAARPWIVRRVAIVGPESTGKSTLAKHLAAAFSTVHVPEHARTLAARRGGTLAARDMEDAARGQLALEEALARQARRVLFADTDLLTCALWTRRLGGEPPPWMTSEPYDLTLLLAPDVPFTGLPERDRPEERRAFFERAAAALEAHGRPYKILQGPWSRRTERAIEMVEAMLDERHLLGARYASMRRSTSSTVITPP